MPKEAFFRTTATLTGNTWRSRVMVHHKSLKQTVAFLKQVDLDGHMENVKSFRITPIAFDDPTEGIREAIAPEPDSYPDIW